ncbi:hypothetical protein BESB_034740 [Besnoitia besnoiti]|uniref:Thiamin pyrophosphokinase thiamin-binding domain-containing protein n=1 Tax=Besnoitia besnoiti TaxID=94643 RepID=A0A2A9MLT4_BESBE|nr:hypothetical protein BESB_034740 [Besnoitia besnoiti]PFH37016.1 hypothetical protein BESB_034740 [Besnoitia besnoiti]
MRLPSSARTAGSGVALFASNHVTACLSAQTLRATPHTRGEGEDGRPKRRGGELKANLPWTPAARGLMMRPAFPASALRLRAAFHCAMHSLSCLPFFSWLGAPLPRARAFASLSRRPRLHLSFSAPLRRASARSSSPFVTSVSCPPAPTSSLRSAWPPRAASLLASACGSPLSSLAPCGRESSLCGAGSRARSVRGFSSAAAAMEAEGGDAAPTPRVRDFRLLERWLVGASAQAASSLSPAASNSASAASGARPGSGAPRLLVLVLNRPLPAYAPHLLEAATSYVVADGGGNFLYQMFQDQEEIKLRARRRLIQAKLDARERLRMEELAAHVQHQILMEHQPLHDQRTHLGNLQRDLHRRNAAREGAGTLRQDKETGSNESATHADPTRFLNRLPDAVCGDLDSLTQEAKAYFERRGVPIVRRRTQDLPDLEKAWNLLLAPQRYTARDVIIILGAIGGRLDHTLSAIHFLHKLNAEYEQEAAEPREEARGPSASPRSHRDGGLPQIYLIGEDSLCFLVPRGRSRVIPSQLLVTRQCALVPFGSTVSGVTTEGLRWNLHPEMQLKFGEFISTSNQILPEVLAGARDAEGEEGISIYTELPLLWYSQMRLQPSGLFIPPLSDSAGVAS